MGRGTIERREEGTFGGKERGRGMKVNSRQGEWPWGQGNESGYRDGEREREMTMGTGMGRRMTMGIGMGEENNGYRDGEENDNG
jgi:hypothetical protein